MKMYFRNRATSVQLVRSIRDAAGKSSTKVIGNVPKATLQLRPAVASQLSDEEAMEFRAYVERYRNTQAARQKLAAHELPDLVASALEYYGSLADGEEKDLIQTYFSDAALDLRRATR